SCRSSRRAYATNARSAAARHSNARHCSRPSAARIASSVMSDDGPPQGTRPLGEAARSAVRGDPSCSRPQLFAIAVLLERFGIHQRLAVLYFTTMNDVANGELDDLVALGARNVGDLHDFRWDVARRGVRAIRRLDAVEEGVFERHSILRLDEQHDAHVAGLAWRPILSDHQRLDDFG